MKLIKYFLCIALAIMFTISMAATAAAADISDYDPERKTGISIRLSCEDKPVMGAQVSIYRVAELIIDENGYAYSYLEDYTGCGLVIDNPQSRDLAEAMYSYVSDKKIKATAQRDSDVHGEVNFVDLEQGLYLIAQTNDVENFNAFSPFLTYLPVTDENGWVYEVDATPKVDITPDNPPPPPPPPSETTVTTTTVTTTTSEWTTPPYVTTPPSVFTPPPTTTTVTTSETEESSEETEETEETEEVSEETEVTEPTTPVESTPIVTTTRDPHDDDANAGQWGEHDPHDDDANAGQWGELAQTGQLNWPIPILAGMGSTFIATGLVMRGTGKKRDDDEQNR